MSRLSRAVWPKVTCNSAGNRPMPGVCLPNRRLSPLAVLRSRCTVSRAASPLTLRSRLSVRSDASTVEKQTHRSTRDWSRRGRTAAHTSRTFAGALGSACSGTCGAAPSTHARSLRADPDAGRLELHVKWDGFRAIVSTEAKVLRVRSRRGWDMTPLVPELAALPVFATLDGELCAFGPDGAPDFPLLCERMLMRRPGIPVTFMIFDL
jgi:ATP-dependent DNA ligase